MQQIAETSPVTGRANVLASGRENLREGSESGAARPAIGDLKTCRRCASNCFKLVCPQTFHIVSVAIACWKCGRVYGYIDNRLIERRALGAREPKDRPPREFVVSHRTARHVFDDMDATEQLLLMGLENGLTPAEAAEAAEVTVEYAHAVGVKHGLMRKSA